MAVLRKDPKSGNNNIYLLLTIILLGFTLGGGLFLVGKSNDVRLDELTIRLTSQTGQIRSELFSLRKDLDTMRKEQKELYKKCAPAAPPPANK